MSLSEFRQCFAGQGGWERKKKQVAAGDQRQRFKRAIDWEALCWSGWLSLGKFPRIGHEMITGKAMILLPPRGGSDHLVAGSTPPASRAPPGACLSCGLVPAGPGASTPPAGAKGGAPPRLPAGRPPYQYLYRTYCLHYIPNQDHHGPGRGRSMRGGAYGSCPPRGLLPHLPPKGLFRSTHILEKAYPTSWNSSSLFSAAPCLLF